MRSAIIFSLFFAFFGEIFAVAEEIIIRNFAKVYNCPCVNFPTGGNFSLLKSLSYSLFVTNRPQTYDCSLNILLGVRNTTGTDFSNPRQIWLFFAESDLLANDLFADTHIPFNSKVFLIKTDGYVSVEELFRVAENFPLNSRRKILLENLEVSLNPPRFNFNNISFLVGADHVMPAAYLVQGETSKFRGTRIEGTLVDIFKGLATMLNYTFTVKWIALPSGALLPNGSWTGLSAIIAKKEIDVLLVMYNMSPERVMIADYPISLRRSNYMVYIRSVYSKLSLTSIFKPFSPGVWISIGCWIIVVSTSFYVVYAIRAKLRMNQGVGPFLAFWEFFYFTLQTLCQQAFSQLPSGTSLRIIGFIAYCMGTVMLPSYSASLISSLTSRVPEIPFTTAPEMVKSGYELVISKESADYNFIVNSGAAPLLNKSLVPVNFNAERRIAYFGMYKYLCESHGSVACLADRNAMEYAMSNSQIGPLCHVTRINVFPSVIHQGFVLPKNSPYTDSFKLRLLHLQQTGIIQRFMKRNQPLKRLKRTRFIDVNIKDVTPMFYILAGGSAIALFFLLLELYFKRVSFDTPIILNSV